MKEFFCKENWDLIWNEVTTNYRWMWFIALIIVWIMIHWCRRKRGRFVRVYTTNRGRIFVKKSAIKGIVKKICHQIVPSSKSRIKICVSWRKIHLRVSVASPHQLQPISLELQQTVSRVLQEEVGIKNLGFVHVVIEKFTGPLKLKEDERVTESDQGVQ